jgi:hypothetical protein
MIYHSIYYIKIGCDSTTHNCHENENFHLYSLFWCSKSAHQFKMLTTGFRGFAECLGLSAKPKLLSAKPKLHSAKGTRQRFHRQRRLCHKVSMIRFELTTSCTETTPFTTAPLNHVCQHYVFILHIL